jgi:hypothetical protein
MALMLDSNFDSGAIDVVATDSAVAEVRIRPIEGRRHSLRIRAVVSLPYRRHRIRGRTRGFHQRRRHHVSGGLEGLPRGSQQ